MPKFSNRRFGTSRLADNLRARRTAVTERPRFYLVLFSAIVITLAALAWPFTIAHMQAIAVLDLVANKTVPSPLREFSSEPVTITELQLPLPSGTVRARLYTPTEHPNAPAILVLHGVHHLGMDEPRLIAFASSMASCGIRVLTPELPGIKDYHVDEHTVAVIGDSAKWMAEESRLPSTGHEFFKPKPFEPVGILGLSFSGGLSLLAAADPRWHPYIKFITAIGSQANMARVAAFYRTGNDPRPDGTIEYLAPHEYGPLVLEYQHLEDFVPANDIAPIREVLRAHLYEDVPAEKKAMAKLTWFQAAQAEQLISTNSQYTREMLLDSERHHLDYAASVSPNGRIGHLDTPVFLLHGEADNIIPAAETLWLSRELPRHSLQAELISPVISHLDMDGLGPTALDQIRLMHFFALILHAAESR